MTQLLNVEDPRKDEILTEAAQSTIPVVLSRRIDCGWATYKSRFLQADSSGRYLVLQQPFQEPGQAPPEFAPGESVGLSFRRGHKKCMCTVEIAQLTQFELGDGSKLPAFQIQWPEKLQEMQRRLYYRADVPPGRRIEAQFWDGGPADQNSGDLRGIPHHIGLLQDLSAGGCRVVVDHVRDPQLQEGDTLCIQFQPDPRSQPIRVDAMFRHREELPNHKVALGFQFVGLEMTPHGRQMLQAISRVVSTFLRIQNRRSHFRLQKSARRR